MNMEKDIDGLLKAGKRAEAIFELEEYVKEHTDEKRLLQLAELLYAEGRMTDALNRFNAVLRLNGENLKANNYVKMIRDILNYYNKDLLNP